MAKIVKATREVVDIDLEVKKLEETNTKGKKKAAKAEPKKTTKKTTNNKGKKAKAKRKRFKFLREVKHEVSKIKWPSKKDMIKYSVATISFVIFFALFFYVIDLIMAFLKAGV